MIFLSDDERSFAQSIVRLVYCNPFLPERIECERAALGDAFVAGDPVWNALGQATPDTSNVLKIGERADAMLLAVRQRIADGATTSAREWDLYEDLVFYVLYHRSRARLGEMVQGAAQATEGEQAQAGPPDATAPARGTRGTAGAGAGAPGPTGSERLSRKAAFYAEFARDAEHFLALPGRPTPDPRVAPHLFACFFQIRRAFHHIFANIIGRSNAAARLRAAAWQSIFTHDVRRYFRVLYDRMADFTSLITGPSGTGKELVARAIGMSRYIPFDPKTRSFAEDFAGSFHPLNLSALSPTLIESELFGHRRGAFTGALEDRAGWLETCPAIGTVFLDEIGELDPVIQVKLLRVLQTRTFQRLGDTTTKWFRGKIIAATNRDLAQEIGAGRFRMDFFYRLCSDIIRTPTLREQLQDSPEELRSLVLFVARRLAGEEAEGLADEVTRWVGKHLGADYPWPGNFRELEQCVRNVLIRHEYHPPAAGGGAGAELAEAMASGNLTAEQMLRRYCKLVYARTRNYEETARRLGLDRRTVKSKVLADDDDDDHPEGGDGNL
jgi:DNA-binding NtrC family response regulator